MSRVYRSLETKGLACTDIHLKTMPVGPQDPGRPLGGFTGVVGPPPAELPHQYMERCRREAEQLGRELLANARREAEKVQREAYHSGFEEGERAGHKLALQKLEPTLVALKQIVDEIQTERKRLIERHEQELIKVAFALAVRIVKNVIDQDSQTVLRVIAEALKKVTGRQKVTLRLSPLDYQMIQQQFSRELSELWPPDSIAIEADEAIGRGGCRIRTDQGDIDATIESQIRTLKDSLWSAQSP